MSDTISNVRIDSLAFGSYDLGSKIGVGVTLRSPNGQVFRVGNLMTIDVARRILEQLQDAICEAEIVSGTAHMDGAPAEWKVQ